MLAAGLTSAACSASGITVRSGDARTSVPAPTATATPEPDTRAIHDAPGIQRLLDAVAAAMVGGDGQAVADLVADPDDAFGRRWRERASNMADLAFDVYELELDETLGNLATRRIRDRLGTSVQLVAVIERHALAGFDQTGPAEELLFLTLIDDNGTWRIVGDDDGAELGLLSVDHLWDHGPVVLTGTGRVQALHHPGTANVDTIVEQAEAAIDEIESRWPVDWPGRVPVIIPGSQEELGELLHVTFDLSNFVAFATATSAGELGAYQLTGVRIMVNPAKFLDRSADSRRRTLLHELLHVATRHVAGPFVPNWLEEGLAQVLGEQRSTTGTRLLDAVVDDELALPRDGQFTSGGRDRIFLSYQAAWGFVDWLVSEFGTGTVGDFYVEISDDADQPGTEPWHVDDAARQVFGATIDELVERWASSR